LREDRAMLSRAVSDTTKPDARL